MAMSTLRVTPSQLKKKGQEFQKDANNFKKIYDKMFELINEINGKVWSGDAATAYKNQFKELQDDANKLYKMAKEFGDDIVEVANEYKKAEDANIATAKTLAKDVIK